MLPKNKILFYSLSLIFIAINVWCIAYEVYYVAFLPLLLVLLFINFLSLDKVILTIVFFTPLSIRLDYIIPDIPVNLYLPTEILLMGVLLLFIFKLLLDGKFDKKILLHPVTIAICINLLWIFISSFTSTLPSVSFKFLISRLWFVIPMYFVATQILKTIRILKSFSGYTLFLW